MLLQSAGGGVLETVGRLAATAGSLLLVLMLVAFGGYAYKQLRGDGVEWPDEESEGEGGITSDGTDDEWDYSR